MQVENIMHKGAKSFSHNATLEELANAMWTDDLGIVPVVDDEEKLKGVITDRDIAIAAALKHRPLWDIRADELTGSQSCHYCQSEDDIHAVLQEMSENKVRRMPVVDSEQHLVGMVSLKDIVDHTKVAAKRRKGDSLTSDEVLETLQKICRPNALQEVA
ncbi:hypothetical protein BKP64_06235 [Marinobacter salinus]|uniref:CBS domain-containing protein n=1 Tax=Marinobacter salinus TaxID=1874317 RepID=A0A1D9GJQ8_9GAMM|nr:CBS domain-containing protein [Marinobacter salinus]AOY87801.1 hypothetical protein BKP64_06235 [Marinobacter salinus]